MPALAEPVSRIFDKVAALNCVSNPVPISANLRAADLLAILCNGNRFLKSDDFQLLLPVYDVTSDEIAAFMTDKINSTFFTS